MGREEGLHVGSHQHEPLSYKYIEEGSRVVVEASIVTKLSLDRLL